MSLKPVIECRGCGLKGKCREHLDNPNQFLCMTFADIRKGEVISGYKCTGHTKDGTWAMFALDNSQEWSQEQREKWEREKQQRKAKQKAEDDRRRQESLSQQEKHRQYSELLSELTLGDDDRADLKRRGFTDAEITLCGYKSVKQYQELQKQYSHLLPGVNITGKGLLCGDGYLLPVRNGDGLIVGLQIRLRNCEGGRYRWLSSATKKNPSGQSPHVHGKGFAELPLSIIKPEKPQGIALVEGVGIKPFLASKRLNLAVVGSAGGQWASSPNLFKDELDKLASELGTQEIGIFPDAGDVANKAVMHRWQEVVDLVTSWGYSVGFWWWEQVTKIDCDIDELLLEQLEDIEYITPEAFFRQQKSGFDWSKEWLKFKEYTPSVKVNLPEFRFPAIPHQNAIIGVKSGLGTGKTKALIDVIKSSPNRAIILGYRNNLLLQTIARALAKNVKIYHLQNDDASYLVPDVDTILALCLDSIHHVDGYFDNTDIYIDEACSVLLHAANGGTLKENQAKAIAILNRALQVCNRVFLLDGNLNNSVVNFIAKIAPDKQIIKIENTAKIPPHKFIFVNSIDADEELKKRDRSPLIKSMLADGVIPWIASDSKMFTDILYKILSDAGKRGYVLNSDTIPEAWAKEFLDNPDEFISTKKPDFFIISPSAESGVSVTIKNYFTDKFTFFAGVQSTDSQHQMLFRLRDNSIPHYVFCPDRSFCRDRSTPRTYSVNLLAETQNNRTIQSAIIASDNSEDIYKVMVSSLARTDKEWLTFTHHLTVIDNREQDNLRKCLMYALEQVGHNIEVVNKLIDEDIKELEKAAKESVIQQHALELFKAEPYDSLETANKIAKGNPGKATQRRIELTRLLDKLPGIKDSEVWGQDFLANYYLKNKEFYRQQLAFYMLNNYEISRKRSEVNWYYQATNQHFFIGQFRDSHLKIWALQQLNILKFTDGEYHKDSPVVVELMEKVRSDKQIALALGCEISVARVDGSDRMAFVSRLLNSIGLKFAKSKQVLVNGVKTRIYRVNEEAMDKPERLAVLEAIARKFDGYLDSEAVKKVTWEEVPVIEAVEAQAAAVEVAVVEQVDELTPVATVLSHESSNDINPELASVQQTITTDTFDIKIDISPSLTVSPTELAIKQLQQVESWEQVTQEMIDLGWWSLSQGDRNRLTALYQLLQQTTMPVEKIPSSGSKCWVWYYSQWLQAVVKDWDYKPHQKFFKAVVDFVDGGSLTVWQRECVQLFEEAIA